MDFSVYDNSIAAWLPLQILDHLAIRLGGETHIDG